MFPLCKIDGPYTKGSSNFFYTIITHGELGNETTTHYIFKYIYGPDSVKKFFCVRDIVINPGTCDNPLNN